MTLNGLTSNTEQKVVYEIDGYCKCNKYYMMF